MPINYKDYPPNWKEIRARILKRANNRCEGCGLSNGYIYTTVKGKPQGIRAHVWPLINDLKRSGFTQQQALKYFGYTTVVLTIAHLDHDKENWDVTDERLRAWCQRCHLNYDRWRHIENRRYGRNFRKTQYKLF
jgi:5-methylcytosine-specific restriction endonuclease McrA